MKCTWIDDWWSDKRTASLASITYSTTNETNEAFSTPGLEGSPKKKDTGCLELPMLGFRAYAANGIPFASWHLHSERGHHYKAIGYMDLYGLLDLVPSPPKKKNVFFVHSEIQQDC